MNKENEEINKQFYHPDSVLSVEGQKKIAENNMKLMLKYTVLLFLILIPIIFALIFGTIYFLRQ
jgi:hypothetical protein